MDVGVAVIVAILSSTGLFGLIQFLVSRHDGKERVLSQIKAQLKTIENKCDRNELATTRLQLIFLIETQPQNKDTILQTAQRYFVELKGNGEAWDVFYRWAKNRTIDLSWYKALFEKRKEANNAEHY